MKMARRLAVISAMKSMVIATWRLGREIFVGQDPQGARRDMRRQERNQFGDVARHEGRKDADAGPRADDFDLAGNGRDGDMRTPVLEEFAVIVEVRGIEQVFDIADQPVPGQVLQRGGGAVFFYVTLRGVKHERIVGQLSHQQTPFSGRPTVTAMSASRCDSEKERGAGASSIVRPGWRRLNSPRWGARILAPKPSGAPTRITPLTAPSSGWAPP